MLKIALVFFLPIFIISCSNVLLIQPSDIEVIDISKTSEDELNATLSDLIEQYEINTIGIAVIKKRKVVWQNQYGWQSDTVPASVNTLFNVASLTKPVVAETVLRLVERGELSLDESIAPYWVDPDLKHDPLVSELTPRMLLTHTSGFMNWRFFSDDNKLAFITPPGKVFGYSGEGFEYLAKYAEKKMGVPFEQLVQTMVFDPARVKDAHLVVDPSNYNRIAKPYDQNGKFYGYYCNPYGYCAEEGSYSAAANLVITISDYAKFLISSMEGYGLSESLKSDRDRLQGVQFEEKDIICSGNVKSICPTKLGYGLGWSMSLFNGRKLIGHRGTNWKTISLAYYYPESGDGLVIFINAPNKLGISGMIKALELLDPDSPEILGYKLRLARFD